MTLMFDRWNRRVDWPEISGAEGDRADGQVVVSVGDEQHCRALLAATLDQLRQAIEECDHIKVTEERTKRGRPEMISWWDGRPRLYEELSWYYASSGWSQLRSTPGLEVWAYVRVGRNSSELELFHTTLTVAADGVAQLGSVPASPDTLREWFAQGKADKQRSWDEMSAASIVSRLFRRQRRRTERPETSNAQEIQDKRQLFLRNFDHDFRAKRDDDLDLFGGQPISKTGDEKQCRQQLTAAAKDLQEAIEDCKNHFWTAGKRQWLQAQLRVKEPRPERGKAGMLPHWDGGPRLYEELHWDPNLVDRVRFWSQNRHTPSLEVQASLPVGMASGERMTWKTALTVSEDGITELGTVPATPDSLREWFAQCVAELPAIPRPEIPLAHGHPRRVEGEIISRSSGADLVLARKKLLEARRLLQEEIELRSRQRSEGRPGLREKTGSAKHPGTIWTWHGSSRLFEETYWWLGDMDSDDPWDECTRTLGYRWGYGLEDGKHGHTDVLMTVSAHRVAELCVAGYLDGSGAEAYPVTIENFRAIIDRRTNKQDP